MSKQNEGLGTTKKMMLAIVTIIFLILGAQAIRKVANR